jgi:hypothetical protein
MMENSWLSRIEALYDAYLLTAAELEKNRRFGDGILGLRPGPADDPCHQRFAAELGALLGESAAQSSSAEAAEILRLLFDKADDKRMPLSAYWMLIAVQGLGHELIGLLSPEDAAGLLAFYRKRYPRRVRLPVQDQILKQLKLQAEKR